MTPHQVPWYLIFLNDTFLFINSSNLCNYADYNTLNAIGKNLEQLKVDLQPNFSILQKWFYENDMILNPGKYHYLFSGGHIQLDWISSESSRKEAL